MTGTTFLKKVVPVTTLFCCLWCAKRAIASVPTMTMAMRFGKPHARGKNKSTHQQSKKQFTDLTTAATTSTTLR